MAGVPNLMFPTVPDNRHADYISTKAGIDPNIVPDNSTVWRDARWIKQVADDTWQTALDYNVKQAQVRFMNAKTEYDNLKSDLFNEMQTKSGKELETFLPQMRKQIVDKRNSLYKTLKENDDPFVSDAFASSSQTADSQYENRVNAYMVQDVHKCQGKEIMAQVQIASENLAANFHKGYGIGDEAVAEYDKWKKEYANWAGYDEHSGQYAVFSRTLDSQTFGDILRNMFLDADNPSGARKFLRQYKDRFLPSTYMRMQKLITDRETALINRNRQISAAYDQARAEAEMRATLEEQRGLNRWVDAHEVPITNGIYDANDPRMVHAANAAKQFKTMTGSGWQYDIIQDLQKSYAVIDDYNREKEMLLQEIDQRKNSMFGEQSTKEQRVALRDIDQGLHNEHEKIRKLREKVFGDDDFVRYYNDYINYVSGKSYGTVQGNG